MRIQRVSNAGILLRLDGVKILLDGFCGAVEPYLATPAPICDGLLASPPDLLAFTHAHEDHFDAALTERYRKQTLRPVLGPENLPFGTSSRGLAIRGVSVLPVKSRHIGKEYFHVPHVSYSIQGSQSVWFMGDATPSQWREVGEKADVIVAPFAYGISDSAWRMTCSLAREAIVLVHMPLRENDPANLWNRVEAVTKKIHPVRLCIPEIGEMIQL